MTETSPGNFVVLRGDDLQTTRVEEAIQLCTDDLGTTNGVKSVTLTIPQDTGSNLVAGMTYARFRLSTARGRRSAGWWSRR